MIAAPSSGAGKTTVTLALLRALRNRGVSVSSAKSGPDYIDPVFHSKASGSPCINLDVWAMPDLLLASLATQQSSNKELLIIEAAMGLFDGAADGTGSAADLANKLSLPVVLVVDCSKQAQSVAALVHGFSSFRRRPKTVGIILNRVGSARHEHLLRRALAPLNIPVIGALYKSKELCVPERHLGLVQANEREDLEEFLETAGTLAAKQIELGSLTALARPVAVPALENKSLPDPHILPPFGQRIAIARDIAFAFCYPHLLDTWQAHGATLSFFSPLANEAPETGVDAVYLPGGYPELHGQQLAHAGNFKQGVHSAANNGTFIFGECGGYMTLGESLIDKNGETHEMLGLLPLETSFATRRLHIGYRKLKQISDPVSNASPLPWACDLSAHEFHYASIVREGEASRLFTASDAEDNALTDMGLRRGTIMGSFAHIISRRPSEV